MSSLALLAQLATRVQRLADGCNPHAEPGQPDGPWEVVGGLRQLTKELVAQIERQETLELQDRFRLREQRREMREMSERRREARSRAERESGVRARGEI